MTGKVVGAVVGVVDVYPKCQYLSSTSGVGWDGGRAGTCILKPGREEEVVRREGR